MDSNAHTLDTNRIRAELALAFNEITGYDCNSIEFALHPMTFSDHLIVSIFFTTNINLVQTHNDDDPADEDKMIALFKDTLKVALEKYKKSNAKNEEPL